METYLPLIKSLLTNWVQSTINDPVYAGALAITVWLLTAGLYSIIIASLKKKIIASNNARLDMENQLNTAQQQTQQMQAELTATVEQMQQHQLQANNETQRAAGFEQQLTLRNQQVASIIQALATSIDLGERPLPVTEDIKAEGLWQQHDRVITLLTTRLRNEQQAKTELQQAYQAETAKRTENEAVIATLQSGLAAQTVQISNLEQALEAQKAQQQQQQELAQQTLAQTLAKHLSELARLTELEQQALTLVNAKQQLTQLEEKLTAKDALINQLETIKPAEAVKAPAPAAVVSAPEIKEPVIEIPPTVEVASPVVIEPQPESPAKGQLGKLKGLFGKTKPTPVAAEPEIIEEKQAAVEIQPEPVAVEQKPAPAAQGQIGKLKNLFGKSKQAAVIAEPEAVETKAETIEIQPEPLAAEPKVNAAKGQLGKLKGIFGSKQPTVTAEQEATDIQFEPLEIKQPPVTPAKARFGKIKHYFGDPKPAEETQQEAEIQPEPVIEQAKVNAAKGQLGKLKNLFGKKQ